MKVQMALTIRSVTTIDECRQIEALQTEIWHTPDIDVVPDHLLITLARNAGIVLLAQEADQPVGFCYSFQAQTNQGRPKHCSHQCGVRPDAQSRNLGYQLKLAQREAVLAQGIDLITWTFDPLLSLNARLNIGKLGAVSQTYIRNLYGDMRAGINIGLDSDRLQVAWHLNSDHVTSKLNGTAAARTISPDLILNPGQQTEAGWLVPTDTVGSFTEPLHYMQMPANIQTLKATAMPLAIAWQQQIRYLFQTAFAAGYVVADFIWQPQQTAGYYLFSLEIQP
jgi:predicted GNAT superfamily acetyltransferase